MQALWVCETIWIKFPQLRTCLIISSLKHARKSMHDGRRVRNQNARDEMHNLTRKGACEDPYGTFRSEGNAFSTPIKYYYLYAYSPANARKHGLDGWHMMVIKFLSELASHTPHQISLYAVVQPHSQSVRRCLHANRQLLRHPAISSVCPYSGTHG